MAKSAGKKKQVEAAPQPEARWQFTEETVQPALTPSPGIEMVSWTADEFIAHPKSQQWYINLGIATGVISLLVYFLTQRDVVSVAVVVIVAIVFGIFASRHPRHLQFAIDSSGIHVGEKLYSYGEFKSFSVMQEDTQKSIWLLPLKRFMPILTIYFEDKDADNIVGVLSLLLPIENREPDIVDRLMHSIKF